MRWQVGHEGETTGDEVCSRRPPGHLHQRPHSAAIRRRRLPDTVGEQSAEASHAGEADFHTDVRHRVLPGSEKMLGGIEPRLNPILMRRHTEHRFELTYEVKGRDLDGLRDVLDRQGLLADQPEQIAGRAQTLETLLPQEHVFRLPSTPPPAKPAFREAAFRRSRPCAKRPSRSRPTQL